MSVYSIDGIVHIGVIGAASEITALDGNSGIALTNLESQRVSAEFATRSLVKRAGLKTDAYVSITRGALPTRLTMDLRDISNATKALFLKALSGDAGEPISSRSATLGGLSNTFQVWIESGGEEFFAPAMALAYDSAALVQQWARDGSFHDGSTITLIATAWDADDEPAAMRGTNAELTGVYFA